MNKLLTTIVGATLGIAMTVSVGVAIANNRETSPTYASSYVWQKMTSTSEFVDGTYILVTQDSYYLNISGTSNDQTPRMASLTLSNNLPSLAADTTNCFKVSGSGSSIKLVKATDTTKWLITGSSNNAARINTGTTGNYWTISSADTNQFYLKSNQNRYLSRYGTTDFRSYTSTGTNANLVLYKLVEDSSGNPTYSVSYNANATVNVGGTTPTAHTGLEDGTNQVLSNSGPTRWGYTFGGWAATADSTTPINSVTIDGDDVVVYAIWNADLTVTGAHASVPFTVAQAKTHIDSGDNLQENYVQGKISQIDSYDSTHSSITYWISDDGTTTNQFQVYSGKGLDGANFSAKTDIETGATVLICGTLKKFSSTYEFDYNNYQVSYSAPVISVTHDITFNVNGGSGTPSSPQSVGDGLTFVFPSAGTKANNIFKGWSTNGSAPFYQEGDTSAAVTADATYNAYWQTEGTSADPYTVVDANAAIAANTGLVGAYTTGTISQVDSFDTTSKGITYHISDDGTTTNQLKIYKGKGISGADFAAKEDVEVGATVTIMGNLKNYNSTYEYDSGSYQTSYSAPASVTLSSLAFSGSMTKTSYTTAEQWDPTGLTVTATYSDASTADVTSSVTWSYYNSSDVEKSTPAAFGAATGQTLKIKASLNDVDATTTATINVETVSFTNTTNLTPGDYYIAYNDSGTKHYISSVAGGKGATVTDKENALTFAFALVGADTWEITNNNKYLGVGSSSTSLTLDSAQTTLSISWENEANGTRKITGSSGRELAWYSSNSDIRTYSGKTDGTNGMTLVDPSVVETTYTISYDGNGATGGSMSDTVGTNPAVASCGFEKTGYSFARWNTQADGEGDDYAIGATPGEDLTLYAIWQEVIEPIGGNVSMAGGSNSESKTVNGHSAIKCGTGSKKGSMTLTLNESNITHIKFYAAAWGGDTTNHTINVSIDSGTVSSNSLTLTNDAGISGNSNFTLNGEEKDYRFDLTLTNAPQGAVITLEAVEASNNRFVVWGATDLFAETFASEFMSGLTCNASGTSAPVFGNGYSWAYFTSLYAGLDSEEQGLLRNATYTKTGSGAQTVITPGEGTTQTIANAVAKYDYIVGKYGTSSYADFITRNPAQIGGSRIIPAIAINNEGMIAVVIVSLVGLTTIGGYFLLKKRKEQ